MVRIGPARRGNRSLGELKLHLSNPQRIPLQTEKENAGSKRDALKMMLEAQRRG